MKTYRLTFRSVDRSKFKDIVQATKKIETRVASEKYQNVRPGDHLYFECDNEALTKTVTNVTVFKSIDEMLRNIAIPDIMPWAHTPEDVYETYYSFPGYKDLIKEYGLIALYLED